VPRSRRRKLNPPRGISLRLLPAELVRICSRIVVVKRGRWTCWEWQGHADENGYGRVKLRGKARWLNRVMCANWNGPLRNGQESDHICHNTRCINPWHLRKKTAMANARDGGHYRQRPAIAAVEEPPF
jgi:hypothetical protein